MTSMQKLLTWGGVGIAIVGYFSLSGGDAAPVKKTAPGAGSAPKAIADQDITPDDYKVSFKPPKAKLRNVFLPGGGEEGEIGIQPMAIDHIPADFAEGDANWTFTGIAQIDGATMALLENPQKHQGGFVKQGEHWKDSLVKRITPESIVMVSKDGSTQVIMRYNPDKPSKNSSPAPTSEPPVTTLPPVNNAAPPPGPPPGRRVRMNGPIGGGNIVISGGPISVGAGD